MTIIGALTAILLLTLLLSRLANQVQRLLVITGMQVASHVFGVLLAALAVQFMFDGIAESGLLN